MKSGTSVKQRILVADDDLSILEAITLILELDTYLVETVSDAKVQEKVLTFHPDLILLDIWMSGGDGREICRTLKEDTKLRSIPIIMISASKDVEMSAKEAGADDFIAKPFEMDELLMKVAHHLQKLK